MSFHIHTGIAVQTDMPRTKGKFRDESPFFRCIFFVMAPLQRVWPRPPSMNFVPACPPFLLSRLWLVCACAFVRARGQKAPLFSSLDNGSSNAFVFENTTRCDPGQENATHGGKRQHREHRYNNVDGRTLQWHTHTHDQRPVLCRLVGTQRLAIVFFVLLSSSSVNSLLASFLWVVAVPIGLLGSERLGVTCESLE